MATSPLELRLENHKVTVNELKKALNIVSDERDKLNFDNEILKMKLDEEKEKRKNLERTLWGLR